MELAVWCAAILVSILVHELGHACVFRYVFGVESNIILHGFGGVTIPHSPVRHYYGIKGLLYEIFLCAAGCLAGFVLAGIAFSMLIMIDVPQQEGFNLLSLVEKFLYFTMIVSIIWGIFNLIPIYPLDGGQISRKIFLFFSPRNGIVNSLILSMAAAIICIYFCMTAGMFFGAILLGFFAYQNYMELTNQSFRY
jgi:Zn-dependent protease